MNRQQQGKNERHSRTIRLWLIAILSCTLIAGTVILIRYGTELAAEKKTETELAEIYHAGGRAEAEETKDSGVTERPSRPDTADEQTPEQKADPAGTGTTAPDTAPRITGRLSAIAYPDNPDLTVSRRFLELLNKNEDIVGWLELNDSMQWAVVQRDHTFYMDHDALKNKNRNGAIFLDVSVSLETRPYTLLLYGHNMKSGAMFGCLRNYENPNYCARNRFISFSSLYEEGRYVIFAAGRIGIEEGQPDYIDPFSMLSDNAEERAEMIDRLKKASAWSGSVDVSPEDQLLILVTCVDDDDHRRVVAARRLREGEN